MVLKGDVEGFVTKTLFVDFGHLRAHEDAQKTLILLENIDSVASENTKLNFTLSKTNHEEQAVKISVKGAASGEMLWDEAILNGEGTKIRMIILAYWDENDSTDKPGQKVGTKTNIVEQGVTKPTLFIEEKLKPQESIKKDISRTFRGRKCETCNKNFNYDETISDWENCNCRWYEKIVNILRNYYREVRSGYREIPSFLKEVWELILGKTKP